jgi:hypothetical protein
MALLTTNELMTGAQVEEFLSHLVSSNTNMSFMGTDFGPGLLHQGQLYWDRLFFPALETFPGLLKKQVAQTEIKRKGSILLCVLSQIILLPIVLSILKYIKVRLKNITKPYILAEDTVK